MTDERKPSHPGPSHPGRSSSDRVARPLPKRTFAVSIVGERDGRHVVMLDDRVARTPGKLQLAVESEALAEALAEEWAGQETHINPASMPLTRFVNTAIDGVTERAEDVAADVVKYAGSDLLVYRADHPTELVRRQAEAWDPVLDWASQAMDAQFIVSEGVMPVTQPPQTLERIARVVGALSPLRLTALHVMTTLMGSAVLALAVEQGRLTGSEAWAAAHVDEDWQISQWGEDGEAAARRALRLRDMLAAERLLKLERS